MQTLIQEKANVVRLRALLEKETDPLVKKEIRLQLAEARLWHDVAKCGVLTPERIEQARRRKCRAGAIVCFVIAGIAAAILVFGLLGCIENTMRGAGNAVQGIGKLVTGVGTDVVRGVDGYSQEK